MSSGGAYAVAQSLCDMEKIKQCKKEKLESAQETLLGIDKKDGAEEELIEFFNTQNMSTFTDKVCVLL